MKKPETENGTQEIAFYVEGIQDTSLRMDEGRWPMIA
jgi:hypothetical protein